MSIRISKFLAAALLVAACDPAGVSGSGATRVTVNAGGQNVTIAAPAGFCVDKRSTSVTSTGAFVLISDCALLGQPTPGAKPSAEALTAAVSTSSLGASGRATQSLADLERYVSTAPGRAQLSRSGRATTARILNTQTQGTVLYVLVEDKGPQPIAGINRRFWRAFLEVNGRLIALSEIGFDGANSDPQQGLNALASFAAAIQAANPAAS